MHGGNAYASMIKIDSHFNLRPRASMDRLQHMLERAN
jgi:hypothetical protein